jgi:hypothetical protein
VIDAWLGRSDEHRRTASLGRRTANSHTGRDGRNQPFIFLPCKLAFSAIGTAATVGMVCQRSTSLVTPEFHHPSTPWASEAAAPARLFMFTAAGPRTHLRTGRRHYDFASPFLACPPHHAAGLVRYGGAGDGGKLLCDLTALRAPCTIYSLGSNGAAPASTQGRVGARNRHPASPGPTEGGCFSDCGPTPEGQQPSAPPSTCVQRERAACRALRTHVLGAIARCNWGLTVSPAFPRSACRQTNPRAPPSMHPQATTHLSGTCWRAPPATCTPSTAHLTVGSHGMRTYSKEQYASPMPSGQD